MRILALEPYFGGSHKAFLDGWQSCSEHEWTVESLPAYKWKWRMRHAAITFAARIQERVAHGELWDLLFCSDMLNLAEFLGLAPESVRQLPRLVYFHENQLTYPTRHESERDFHYVFTNMTTALAADQVWFNSQYHRESFLEALDPFLKRLPDFSPRESIELIRQKSDVQPQGVPAFPSRGPRRDGPTRILWAHRWEHDKDPESFFAAIDTLRTKGLDFRLSVLGEQFRAAPPIFEEAKGRFAAQIDHWGYLPSREEYEAALLNSDIVASTAQHEFFGVGVVEAVAAGAFPCVPRRLAYPEVLGRNDNPDFFYEDLAERLSELIQDADPWKGDPHRGRRQVESFLWKRLAPVLDSALPLPRAHGLPPSAYSPGGVTPLDLK